MTFEIIFYWSSLTGNGHDPLASNDLPEDNNLIQYVDSIFLASLFPGDRGKLKSEYGLVKEF